MTNIYNSFYKLPSQHRAFIKCEVRRHLPYTVDMADNDPAFESQCINLWKHITENKLGLKEAAEIMFCKWP